MAESKSWNETKDARADTPERRRGYQAAKSAYEWGEAIRGERERHGLTQAELAERIGSTQPSVARLEAGGVNPSIDTLARVADALGLELVVEFRSPAVA